MSHAICEEICRLLLSGELSTVVPIKLLYTEAIFKNSNGSTMEAAGASSTGRTVNYCRYLGRPRPAQHEVGPTQSPPGMQQRKRQARRRSPHAATSRSGSPGRHVTASPVLGSCVRSSHREAADTGRYGPPAAGTRACKLLAQLLPIGYWPTGN